MENYDSELIVAHSWPEFGIGMNNKIPWKLKEDLLRFKEITTNVNNENEINIVIMGRKTYDSLPSSVKPLPDRINVVITSNDKLHKQSSILDNIYYTSWKNLNTGILNIEQTISNLKNKNKINKICFIGGQQIYKLALETYKLDKILVTEVYLNQKKCMNDFDSFFPKYEINFNQDFKKDSILIKNSLTLLNVSNFKNEHDLYYRYFDYYSEDYMKKKLIFPQSQPEWQYLKVMRQILNGGIERNDRTNTGTLSLFGTTQRYDLSETFPMSTTKKIFIRAVFEELMLYLSGKTDNKILQDKKIHIWDGNTSREFLDKRGLKRYPEGDMGETYGFNMRHFGGEYKDCKTEYDSNNGYDQLQNVIHLLKNDPTSRRIIINLWNPSTLHNAALPSCLMMYQFYVDTHAKTLSCLIYIRSSDYFLANNWNTCTGALLVNLLCNLKDIDLTPGEIIVNTGDTHIYKNHIEQVNENLKRKPYPFCKLLIKNKKSNINDFKFEDLRFIGYKCYPNIKADMAV
tara:strand:+ start:2456 stop:4000 length:1545 start_codon:yes stop_codon:yes gene_type:complete